MDAFLIVYRLSALGIIVFWVIQLVIAARQPAEWQPPRADRFPIRVTRNLYLLAGGLGIVAGATVFALSYVLFS